MMRWLITLVVPIAAVPQLNASTQNVSISCKMNVSLQAEGYLHEWCKDVSSKAKFPACYPAGVPEWHPENNIIVQLPDPSSCPVTVSPEWIIAGWSWKYIQLAPGESYPLSVNKSEQAFMKLIRGSVLDVNQIGVQAPSGH